LSKPKPAPRVKLILSAIYSDRAAWQEVLPALEQKFGLIDYSSKEMEFGFTDFYEKEMGAPLFRQVLSFNPLTTPDELPAIKIFTNALEEKFCEAGRRKVNLDPGYLGLDHLVLATCKRAPHRVYLKDGIWADLHLVYQSGSFQPFDWTYPDYRSEALVSLFNRLRESLKDRLKPQEASHAQ